MKCKKLSKNWGTFSLTQKLESKFENWIKQIKKEAWKWGSEKAEKSNIWWLETWEVNIDSKGYWTAISKVEKVNSKEDEKQG